MPSNPNQAYTTDLDLFYSALAAPNILTSLPIGLDANQIREIAKAFFFTTLSYSKRGLEADPYCIKQIMAETISTTHFPEECALAGRYLNEAAQLVQNGEEFSRKIIIDSQEVEKRFRITASVHRTGHLSYFITRFGSYPELLVYLDGHCNFGADSNKMTGYGEASFIINPNRFYGELLKEKSNPTVALALFEALLLELLTYSREKYKTETGMNELPVTYSTALLKNALSGIVECKTAHRSITEYYKSGKIIYNYMDDINPLHEKERVEDEDTILYGLDDNQLSIEEMEAYDKIIDRDNYGQIITELRQPTKIQLRANCTEKSTKLLYNALIHQLHPELPEQEIKNAIKFWEESEIENGINKLIEFINAKEEEVLNKGSYYTSIPLFNTITAALEDILVMAKEKENSALQKGENGHNIYANSETHRNRALKIEESLLLPRAAKAVQYLNTIFLKGSSAEEIEKILQEGSIEKSIKALENLILSTQQEALEENYKERTPTPKHILSNEARRMLINFASNLTLTFSANNVQENQVVGLIAKITEIVPEVAAILSQLEQVYKTKENSDVEEVNSDKEHKKEDELPSTHPNPKTIDVQINKISSRYT